MMDENEFLDRIGEIMDDNAELDEQIAEENLELLEELLAGFNDALGDDDGGSS